MSRRIASLLLLFITGCTCEVTPEADGGRDAGMDAGFDAGPPSGRCELELANFFEEGTGTARGARITSESQLLTGPNAHGKVGDFRLENDKIRVIIQAEGRAFGPLPYGGTIIDADLAGPGAGNDQFGEVGLLYNFGRTLKGQEEQPAQTGGPV